MKSLQDALYNWLTIQVVAEARPDDEAAQETAAFFRDILKNDFAIRNIDVQKQGAMYVVRYEKERKPHAMRFPAELIEAMLEQMENEPDKYMNYPT